MLGEKGKHASATQIRRFVWKEVVWPLVLELGDTVFTPAQYRAKRDEVCKSTGVSAASVSRGLVSLIQKGLLYREERLYGIHYRLVPYMRLNAECDYATAINETRMV